MTGTCTRCARTGRLRRADLCSACYQHLWRAGRLPEQPAKRPSPCSTPWTPKRAATREGPMVRGPVFICGGDAGTARRREDDCPNALHDWPLPIGYADADVEAHWRLRNRWSNVRCPDCRLYGWLPGRLTDAHVRRPALADRLESETDHD